MTAFKLSLTNETSMLMFENSFSTQKDYLFRPKASTAKPQNSLAGVAPLALTGTWAENAQMDKDSFRGWAPWPPSVSLKVRHVFVFFFFFSNVDMFMLES